jgi:hypothetical protein
VGQQAVEPEDARGGQAARQLEGGGRVRIDPRPVIAAVDLEPDVERNAGRLEQLERLRRVQRDPQRDAFGQTARLVEAGRDERERPGDVIDAVVGEDARFVQRRDRHAARAVVALQVGHLDALVGLEMRAQRDPERVAALRHAGQVGFEAVAIEQQRWGREVGELE